LPFPSVLQYGEKESEKEESQANLRNFQGSGVCAMAFKFFGRQKEGKCRNAGMSCSACATMYVPPSPDSPKAAARRYIPSKDAVLSMTCCDGAFVPRSEAVTTHWHQERVPRLQYRAIYSWGVRILREPC
jgi:hypothetical protein